MKCCTQLQVQVYMQCVHMRGLCIENLYDFKNQLEKWHKWPEFNHYPSLFNAYGFCEILRTHMYINRIQIEFLRTYCLDNASKQVRKGLFLHKIHLFILKVSMYGYWDDLSTHLYSLSFETGRREAA